MRNVAEVDDRSIKASPHPLRLCYCRRSRNPSPDTSCLGGSRWTVGRVGVLATRPLFKAEERLTRVEQEFWGGGCSANGKRDTLETCGNESKRFPINNGFLESQSVLEFIVCSVVMRICEVGDYDGASLIFWNWGSLSCEKH